MLGPVSLGLKELCEVLGVSSEMATGARRRRLHTKEEKEKPGWLEGERRLVMRQKSQGTGASERPRVGASSSHLRSSLERQFELFTRWGREIRDTYEMKLS